MGVFAVDFRRRARNWWGLRRSLLVSHMALFEGRRDGGEGQGAGVVQVGVDGGGNVGKVAGTPGISCLPMPRLRVDGRASLGLLGFSLWAASVTIKLSRRWAPDGLAAIRCG